MFVFVLLLVFVASYFWIKQRQIDRTTSKQYHINESIDIIKQEVLVNSQVLENNENKKNIDICQLSIEDSLKKCPLNEQIFTKSLRKLICYCDGSYSSRTRIGYSAFHASNGYVKYRRCPVRYPYIGSTESEVFAAYLALQYTAKYQYDILILYTDNSKVEQLLRRPKKQDYYAYPKIYQAYQQCFKGNKHFRMQVKRVRGHTTWYEQQKSLVKHEFAKVDRQVRQRRQQHEYLYNFSNTFNNYHLRTHFNQYIDRYNRITYLSGSSQRMDLSVF